MNKYWAERAMATRADALNAASAVNTNLVFTYNRAAGAAIKAYEKLLKPFLLKDKKTYDVEAIKQKYRTDAKFRREYSRLAAHIEQYQTQLATITTDKTRNLMIGVYELTQTGLVDKHFDLLNTQAVKIAVEKPWTSDGIKYSERIWKNTDRLKAQMQSIMLDSVLKGQNPRKTARLVRDRFDVQKHQAERLVRTETMAIYNQAAIDSYRELGITEYKILGAPQCDGLCPAGKTYRIDQFQMGVTAPPFHPNCKCCIIPVV